MGSQYLRICCMASFGILFFSVFEKTLQATGRSLYSTIAQVAGALTNIVLDPIMIYGLLGCPKLGVEGAAWATVLGQIASLALAAVFHFRLNRELPFRRKALRLRRSIVGEIYSIGVPAIIAQGAMSVMNYCVNLIFGSLDSSYVTAYGIVYKIQQFVLFAAFGLRDAITPIVSFSYGMQTRNASARACAGLMYTSVLMLVCTAAVEILAQPLAGIFSLSAGTMGLCVTGLRVLAVSFVFAGANIAIQGVFQATEGGVQSLLVSLLRQLIFVLPAAWLFARLLPAGVWMAFPIAEVLTAVIAAVLLRHTAGKGRLSQQDHAASLSK
ncbi:MAG: MATE family efflux transporter [Butyricicoccus sp.]